jgi:hypothetical protein
MVGDYFFFGFFTRAGNFLYWVDFAHFMQSTEPSKPPDAKQARDCALDLKGMVIGKLRGRLQNGPEKLQKQDLQHRTLALP